MRVLYFDCFAGASGDMMLGALVDAGLPLETLKESLRALPLDGWELRAERVVRQGVSATSIVVADQPHPHEHHHRGLAEIVGIVDRSTLPPGVKARSKGLFERLARAEAEVHGIPVDEVHFHEVGAVDSIVDIVGAVAGLEWFGADEVVSSPLNVGRGTVECAHGTLPVPAPATARLVQGAPVYSAGPDGELLTPTGALLVTGFAARFGPLPAMRVERIGYGAGTRTTPGWPNVLRLFVGETAEARPRDTIVVVECDIDDMSPQLFGPLMERLLASGAVDVYYTPVQMKKGRPGILVTALAPPDRRESVVAALFRETTTIGVRYHEAGRECLGREFVTVPTRHGDVRIKLARLEGRTVNAMPEFDDCARLASQRGVPVREVQAEALRAYHDRAGGPDGD